MTLSVMPNPAPTSFTESIPSSNPVVKRSGATSREQESTMNLLEQPARSILVEPREPDSPRPPGQESSDAPRRTPVARCADGHGTMTGLFFSDNVIDIARAKAMCGLCALQESCLQGAIEREEPWGVWGGELLSGGRIIANKRPCGRPPKNPRPELVIDELGPVPVAVA
jgi:WhiB family redox-sensing transcriptional regulator